MQPRNLVSWRRHGLGLPPRATLFDNYGFLARDCAVTATFRVIAPSHLALYQRRGVIISISVAFCEYRGKCRRQFFDLADELVLTPSKPRVNGRDRRYFWFSRERIVGELS